MGSMVGGMNGIGMNAEAVGAGSAAYRTAKEKAQEAQFADLLSAVQKKAEAAKEAKAEFDRVHSQNLIPTEMDEFELSAPVWIVQALTHCGLCSSSSQARRDIAANAVSLNQEKIADEQLKLGAGEYVLQVGKRKFAKLKVS